MTDTVERVFTLESGPSTLAFDGLTTFHNFSVRATVLAGEAIPGAMSGWVSMRVDGLRSGDSILDREMLKPSNLDAARHPEIRLQVQRVDGQIPGEVEQAARLTGQLHLRGRVVPVESPVRHSLKGERFQVSGSFPFDIRSAGIDPPTLMVVQRMKPVVQIRFSLVFLSAGSRTGRA